MLLFVGGGSLKPTKMGAYLGSAQNGGGTTPTKIALNTIDPAYPATNLVSNGLVVDNAGSITITARAAYPFNIQVQIRVNGVTVATGNSGNPSTANYTYVAAAGDQITLWETDSLSGQAITTGAANTWLHYDPN